MTRFDAITAKPQFGAPLPVCTPAGYTSPATNAPGSARASVMRLAVSLFGKLVCTDPKRSDIPIPSTSEMSSGLLRITLVSPISAGPALADLASELFQLAVAPADRTSSRTHPERLAPQCPSAAG